MTVGIQRFYSGRWEKKRSELGYEYQIWSPDVPIRILDEYLDCSIYLYPSVSAARSAAKAGGSGFVVGIPSATRPDKLTHYYAVTNLHVIEDARSPVIRINSVEGAADVLDISPAHWKPHPRGDDVAACPLGFSGKHKFRTVGIDKFLTQEKSSELFVGPGDEVFLVGRFIDHEGLHTNQPSVRFGAISMMPSVPIKQESGHLQVSYLVELHSISGYSGSPVFLFVAPFSDLSSRRENHWPPQWSIWLLGVDWGHIQKWETVRDNGVLQKNLRVPLNSGMMGVVPAWQLLELLNCPEFMTARKSLDEAVVEHEPVGVSDAVQDEDDGERADEKPFTQADFEAALKKVARKIEPEK